MKIEVNPYNPAVVFRIPQSNKTITGIVIDVDPETKKIRVQYHDIIYVIRPDMIELIQY